MNLLFICSRNQWRSPTAETVFRRYSGVTVRSVGTTKSARRRVTEKDLDWADLIFVMEDKHKSRLRQDFRDSLKHARLHVLNIPDDYRYMDAELIEILEAKIPPFLT